MEVCLKPVMLLVINAPQDAKAEEVKRFLPKCQKVTKLGLSSFEATYSTVEEATEAIDFAKKTKFEGKRLLCYFCKKGMVYVSIMYIKVGQMFKPSLFDFLGWIAH